jgi:3-dehydroshikimate dehydratase
VPAPRSRSSSTRARWRTATADGDAAALALRDAVDRPNVRTFWQPPVGADAAECVVGLRRLQPRLSNVHAFHWSPRLERQPFASGRDRWYRYLDVLAAGGARHAVSLEFVRADDPEQFLADAESLVRGVERALSAQSSSGPLR